MDSSSIVQAIVNARKNVPNVIDALVDKYIKDVLGRINSLIASNCVYSVYNLSFGIKDIDFLSSSYTLVDEVRHCLNEDLNGDDFYPLVHSQYNSLFECEEEGTFDFCDPAFQLFLISLEKKGFSLFIESDVDGIGILYPFINIDVYDASVAMR